MAEFNFDEQIDRREVPALKTHALVLGDDGAVPALTNWYAAPVGWTPDALTDFLRKKAGWAIARGIAFGPEGAGFGRLNIACPRARLSAAQDALNAALADPRHWQGKA